MENSLYTCLWFDGNAAEAANYYCNVFEGASLVSQNTLVSIWQAAGQRFMCLNGGAQFKLNPSISYMVIFENKETLNKAYQLLGEDGKVLMPLDSYAWSDWYVWVQDRFGTSWQLYLGNIANVHQQQFVPTLMFTGFNAGKAEEAMHFYTSIFTNSGIDGVLRYGTNEGDVPGRVKHAQFIINNYLLMAMDSSAAHQFQFNEAFSLVVTCQNQEEIDHYWNSLTAGGGSESMCGWLKDKYGISWQIVPQILEELLSDAERAPRVVQAFLKMRKFDIAGLLNA